MKHQKRKGRVHGLSILRREIEIFLSHFLSTVLFPSQHNQTPKVPPLTTRNKNFYPPISFFFLPPLGKTNPSTLFLLPFYRANREPLTWMESVIFWGWWWSDNELGRVAVGAVARRRKDVHGVKENYWADKVS